MASIRFCWQGLVIGLCVVVLAGCGAGKRLTEGGDNHQPLLPPPPSVTPVTDKGEGKSPVSMPDKEPVAGYRMSGDDPLVSERVSFYEKTLDQWRETLSQLTSRGEVKDGTDSWRDCLLAAQQALAGYNSLEAGQERDANPWSIVARDVGYYEKGCDQVLAALQGRGSAVQSDPSLLPPGSDGLLTQLREHYDARDYQGAITTYEAMTPSQEPAQVSRDVRELYGKSLVKTGRFEDAAAIYTGILAEFGPVNDLKTLELRLETGDVLLAAGRVDDARQVYQGHIQALSPLVSQQEWAEAHAQAFAEQVAPEDMLQYRELMRAYLLFDGKQIPPSLIEGVAAMEGSTPGPFLDLAKIMLGRVRTQAQTWAREQLAEIRSLIDLKKLDEAHALLGQVIASASPEIMGVITQFQAEIAQAQALGQVVPGEATAPEAVDPWQETMVLFEHQKYDEAIVGFQKFEGTERAAEAQAKIAESVELAASAMRRQAAALFAKARNTFDPEIKRQTLQSSRVLLGQLIEKYPQATVIDKARQNMKVIDAELGILSSSPPSLP
ncbi:MAG: tetratricopeptide repeat protein [Proteobacteria bacterium]|nr:tetratricopeptide repeat protein [Desulfobulbaceae bacterium]MBU4153187.1 tetratricopeptide repeat protein [Pseudomonadota bacterium]